MNEIESLNCECRNEESKLSKYMVLSCVRVLPSERNKSERCPQVRSDIEERTDERFDVRALRDDQCDDQCDSVAYAEATPCRLARRHTGHEAALAGGGGEIVPIAAAREPAPRYALSR